jgi:hypothetical protein
MAGFSLSVRTTDKNKGAERLFVKAQGVAVIGVGSG